MKISKTLKNKKILQILVIATIILLIPVGLVHAQSVTDPTQGIVDIINNVKNILGKVGSAVLIFFIVKDAFEIMSNPNAPEKRGEILRSISLKVIAAIFLFNPDFVLNAIKFIANVK